MKRLIYVFHAFLIVFLLAGSSCSTKDTTGDIASKEKSEKKCVKIFEKYLVSQGSTFDFEVVASQDNTCMISEKIEDSAVESGDRKVIGNRIFTVDVETNEVRQFPNR